MIDAANDPSCPRCGYDQRGAMATWTSSCPLRGTCTECGLEFDWVNVVVPGRIKPMWCVEYARGRWGMIASVFTTAAHQAVPWLFWRRVAMHHKPRFGRIALYVAIALSTGYVALTISQGQAAWREYHQPAWGGGMPIPPPPGQPAPPTPPTISPWHAVTWTMLMPFSSESPGAYMRRGIVWRMFPAPRVFLKRNWVNPYRFYDTHGRIHQVILLALFWLQLLVLMPVAFALLPQTRRTAKVRWSHIIRIGMYGAAFTAPLLWWAMLREVPRFGLLVMLFLTAINLIWWGCACSAYLRLPRPWFIASMLTFMLLLAGIAVQFYLLHDLFIRHILRWA